MFQRGTNQCVLHHMVLWTCDLHFRLLAATVIRTASTVEGDPVEDIRILWPENELDEDVESDESVILTWADDLRPGKRRRLCRSRKELHFIEQEGKLFTILH